LYVGQQPEYLGIIIDTVGWTISFSPKKLAKLIHMITEWRSKTECTRKELQQLIGRLIHASVVYFGGGTFTRPLIHQLKHVPSHHKLQLLHYPDVTLSLIWWETALTSATGRPITEHWRTDKFFFHTDASLTLGMGALYNNAWFSIRSNSWDPRTHEPDTAIHINILELLALVLACATWGSEWSGHRVTAFCDNLCSVNVILAKRSKDVIMNKLLMRLHLLQVQHGFVINPVHLPTEENVNADDLSRFRFSAFHRRNPLAPLHGVPVRWSALPTFAADTLLLPSKDQDSLVPAEFGVTYPDSYSSMARDGQTPLE
jgi:hypothetical protein